MLKKFYKSKICAKLGSKFRKILMEKNYNNNEKALIFLSLFDLMPQKEAELLSLFDEPSELLENFYEREKEINKTFVKLMKRESQAENISEKYHKTVAQMKKAIEDNLLESYIKNLNSKNILVLTPFSEGYPKKLLELEFPPQTIFCLGDISLLNSDCIGVVGTRTPTSYGKLVTEKFCKGLSQNNFTIVSGLAAGVDSVAHKTALEAGGKTIAVLGGGFEHIFPTFNTELARRISRDGLLITEYRPSMQPALYTFPQRNRIIAGLSLGILLTEAGEKSGSLHTKEFALELGREVFAVPGNINSAMSKGTNRLIRSAQGACVLSFEDIVCTFRENVVKSPSVSNLQFSVEDQLILKHLENGEKTIEQLVELTGFQIGKLNANLTMLEIRGVVKQLPGNSYILV